jgi:hypothetical protein
MNKFLDIRMLGFRTRRAAAQPEILEHWRRRDAIKSGVKPWLRLTEKPTPRRPLVKLLKPNDAFLFVVDRSTIESIRTATSMSFVLTVPAVYHAAQAGGCRKAASYHRRAIGQGHWVHDEQLL